MKKNLKELLKTVSAQLYQFAYVMIPDDLQAQQLVIDSCSSFMFQESEVLDFFRLDINSPSSSKLARLYKSILPYLYDLGMKRSSQLEAQMRTFSEKEQNKNFYSLDVSARSLLFLRIQKGLSYSELEKLSKLPRSSVVEKIHNAREKLLSKRSREVEAQQAQGDLSLV